MPLEQRLQSNTKAIRWQPKIMCVLVFVCLQFFGTQIQASGAQADAVIDSENVTQDQALQQVRAELADVERRWYGLTRVRLSYPQKASAGFGAMFVEQAKNSDCSVGCVLQGWHFEVEPGIGGLQGSVGWGKLVGETGNTKRLMHTVHYAWAVRGVVLRTWRDDHFELNSQTWAGIEGNFSIIRLNFSLALMHALPSNHGQAWLISGGVGWGF